MELKDINYELVNFISHTSEIEVHEKKDWNDFRRGEVGYVDEEGFDDFYGPKYETSREKRPTLDKGHTFYEFEIVGEELTSSSATPYTTTQESQDVNLNEMDNEQIAEYFKEKYGDRPDEPFECPYGYERKNQEETVTDEVYAEEEKKNNINQE